MDDFDLVQWRRNPQWRTTLRVYYDLQQESAHSSPDSGGWVPRQTDVPGIDPALLSSIHGKLIAFGLLKYDVAGRDVGVLYQLTHQGRRALLGETEPADGEAAEWSESA